MQAGRFAVAIVVLGLAVAGCGGPGHPATPPATSEAFSIAMWGDTPYAPGEAIAVPKLVDQVNAAGVDFTVFIGDLQGGCIEIDHGQ